MTSIEHHDETSGEARLALKRRKFWTYLGRATLAAALVGGVIGGGRAASELAGLSGWIVAALAVLAIGAWVWFSRDYFRRIDELELQDNLWASLIALYFFVAATPFWLLLHDLGFAPEPDTMTLWWATIGAMAIAYGVRKLR